MPKIVFLTLVNNVMLTKRKTERAIVILTNKISGPRHTTVLYKTSTNPGGVMKITQSIV